MSSLSLISTELWAIKKRENHTFLAPNRVPAKTMAKPETLHAFTKNQSCRAIKALRKELSYDAIGQRVSELRIFEKFNFQNFPIFQNHKSVNFGRRDSVRLLAYAQWSYHATRTQ